MFKRFRYRRVDEKTRLKYREIKLEKKDFIWPVFLMPGKKVKEEIKKMPDVFRYSLDVLLNELKKQVENGLKSILLFGIPAKKNIEEAYSKEGIINKSIPLIKDKFPGLEIITDVCLCSYTKDGHCHVGDNDETCKILAKIAVSHAKAGADIVAPSDMMDGRIYFIKHAFNENNIKKTKLLSYSAKYASSFYSPFREAADCSPKNGDRKTYQMDFYNSNEAMEEIEADIEEGADQIMIKPALSYLDIINKAKQKFNTPIVAYNVSGEYSALKNAINAGLMPNDVILEVIISIKRAGADKIVSYFTPYILEILEK